MKRRVTIKDVSARAGVSIATVSRVVNGTAVVSSEVSRRVQEAIEFLCYRSNALAMGLKSGRTGVVGLVVPRLKNIFFMEVMESLERAVESQGYSLLVAATDNDAQREARAISRLLARQVDGLVVATSGVEGDFFEGIAREACPVVLVDRRIEGARVDMVSEENERTAYRLAREILRAGCGRIAVLVGHLHLRIMCDRLAGVRRAIEEAGLLFDEQLVLQCDNDAFAARDRFLPILSQIAGFDLGVISLNGQITEGVLMAAAAAKLCVPRDFSLVSFGQLNSPLIVPRVTCVAQDGTRVGAQAGRILLERLAGGADEGEPVCEDVVLENVILAGKSIR